MKKIIKTTFIFVLLNAILFALTGEEILRKMDKMRVYETIEYKAEMKIYLANQPPRVKTMYTRALGEEKAYIEFLNAEDAGNKYLKIKKRLWLYDAEEEASISLSGHYLKQGIMGSDISFEDAAEADSLYEKYDIKLHGKEKLDGISCFLIELNATTKRAPYHQRKMWVDTERYVTLKEEMYSKSGKLLKTMNVLEVEKFSKRYYPTKFEMINAQRKSKTVLRMYDVKFNASINEGIFNLRYLQR